MRRRNNPAMLLACAVCVLLMFGPARDSVGQGKEDPEMKRVLGQMEKVGKTFRSFTAQISKKKYTAILKEFDTPEAGEFYYARAKDGSALMRQEIVSPTRVILTIKNGQATVYQPGIRQARILNLGRNRDKAEYLAIGIGQSPAKLQETFSMSFQGTEQVGSSRCSVLVLKPKDKKTAAMYASITMWVQESSGIPVQYKFQEPNKDYLLVNFTGEKLNVKIPDSKFEQKIPNGVDIQRF